MSIPTEFEIVFTVNKDEDFEEKLSDVISSEYGYCHYGFDYKLINENNNIKLVKVSNVQWDLED